MATGIEIITRIAELNAYIDRAERVGGLAVSAKAERDKLRRDLAGLPDLTFS